MSISIKDVAKKAKVSEMTVSRVINNSPSVKPSTREEVLKIIQELGYQPNLAARGLVRGKTNIISFVTPCDPDFFGDYYFREITKGLGEALSKEHYFLICYKREKFQASNEIQVSGLQADGLILLAAPPDDLLRKQLESQKKPVVLINARTPDWDWVDMDNAEAGEEVTSELIKLGHRRIAFIKSCVPTDRNPADRMEGYKKALQKAGIPFDEKLVVEGNYETSGGHAAAQALMKQSPRPTAIFGMNDYSAMGAMKAVLEAGMKVPEDISIVGFDDVETAAILTPALSTVSQPFVEMGQAAGELLLRRIKNPQAPQKSAVLKGRTVLRQSTGPASAGR